MTVTKLHRLGSLRWEFYHANPEDAMILPVWWGARRAVRFTLVFGRLSARTRRHLTDPRRRISYRLITLIPRVVTLELRRTTR